MKEKPITREQLENIGGLITIKGTNRCLGDLLYCESIPTAEGGVLKNATFCPNNGRVPVTKEEADIHNRLLDTARIEGLDKNCQVGQGSYAYWAGSRVTTFLGTVLSDRVEKHGNTVTFWRKGMTFRGRLPKAGNSFNWRRIA